MKVINLEQTASNIKAKIHECGFTCPDIAEELGITSVCVYYWTSARSLPSINNFINLAEILNCKVDDLIITEEVEF